MSAGFSISSAIWKWCPGIASWNVVAASFVIRPARQVVRVDVVGAGPRAVDRRRVVVRERRVLLLERLDGLDDAAGPREPAEHPGREGAGALDVLVRARDQLLDGGGLVGRIGHDRRAIPVDVVAVAGRCAIARRSSSIVASSSRPIWWTSRGSSASVVQRSMRSGRARRRRAPTRARAARASPRGTRPRARRDTAGRPGRRRRARPRARARGRRRRRPATGRDDPPPRSAIVDEPLELVDRPLGDDPGRRPARGAGLVEDLDVRVHERPVGPQPVEPALEALGRVGLLERRDLGQQRLGAVDLVDRADLVHPEVSSRSARSASSTSMPRVTRSSTVSVSSGIACAASAAAGRSIPARPPHLRGIGSQEVVVAGVAVDGRGGRVLAGGTPPRTRR